MSLKDEYPIFLEIHLALYTLSWAALGRVCGQVWGPRGAGFGVRHGGRIAPRDH